MFLPFSYHYSLSIAPFNATIRVWLFSVPEFDGKGVYNSTSDNDAQTSYFNGQRTIFRADT